MANQGSWRERRGWPRVQARGRLAAPGNAGVYGRQGRSVGDRPSAFSALAGDELYGDRENLRRYRDVTRDEHRRFAAEYERSLGGLARTESLTEYDRFEADLTRSAQGRNQVRHPPPERPRFPRNRGRGPRGFQRPDTRVYEDVCECLTQDERIDPSDVVVEVKGGQVTLSGQIRSRAAKRRATDLIERIRGVRDVYNNIRVSDEQRTLRPPTRRSRD